MLESFEGTSFRDCVLQLRHFEITATIWGFATRHPLDMENTF